MEIDGHEELTGEEIDHACDTRDETEEVDYMFLKENDADPHGQRQEEFCN